MATNFPKINESDYADKGVRLLPDRPSVESAVLKREFDELSLDVIIPAFNLLIDVLQNSYSEMPDNVKTLLDKIGNVGGITAKYFNRTADAEWNSTISNVDDIPVNWCGYVYTAMGAATEGFLICFGLPNHACKVQINISLYGGKVFYRYLSGTAWCEWTELVKGTDLAKYLPLTGGEVNGIVTMLKQLRIAGGVSPTSDNSQLLGSGNFAWANVCARIHSLYRNGIDYGSMFASVEGTESALGIGRLTLGNGTAQGTAGNAMGNIQMYGKGSGLTHIYPSNAGANNNTLYLPNTSGTLALTSDITALNTLTTHEQEVVDHFIANVFPSQTVSTTAVPSGMFLKDGYTAWHGMHPLDNYASYVLYGYNMRCLHLSCTDGTWTTKVMDNA